MTSELKEDERCSECQGSGRKQIFKDLQWKEVNCDCMKHG